MKLQLIAIVMIALLVLTVVPMAVTATKAPKTVITEKIYLTNYDANIGAWVQGPLVGKITLDTVTGAYSFSLNQLPPSEVGYRIGITPAPFPSPILWMFIDMHHFTPDAHGHISVSGVLPDYDVSEMTGYLANGGVFGAFESYL